MKPLHIQPITTTTFGYLCTSDSSPSHDEACSTEECAKLSFGAEATNDNHLQQLSLPNSDDSLSAVLSEESDCTAVIRVYDLNKRVTKILRHDIIKRSRNRVGTAVNRDSFECLDNRGSDKHSLPETKIKQFAGIQENINQTQKPIQSLSRLTSIHLNRNPHKIKLSNMKMFNDIIDRRLDFNVDNEMNNGNKSIDYNSNIIPAEGSLVDEMIQLNVTKTKNIAELNIDEKKNVRENRNGINTDESDENRFYENIMNFSSNERFYNLIEDIIPEKKTSRIKLTDENSEENHSEIELQIVKQIPHKYVIHERCSDIAVEVNKHKERSAIEQDIILLLPSVKALAQSFSLQKGTFKKPEVNDGTKV